MFDDRAKNNDNFFKKRGLAYVYSYVYYGPGK